MVTIHKTADVQSENIGDSTVIWQFCIVLPKAVIGSNCNINCNVFIENDVFIGNNVTIKPGVQVWDGIRIHDNVFVGPNVTFTNDIVARSKVHPEKFVRTDIEEGASVGANSTIVSGCNIGRYAFIGAGSVITCPVPPFTLWFGNPARHKGYITRDAVIIDLNLRDKKGNKYRIENFEPVLL
ncbi:MAG: acyltransferase [Bacteroidota bacterium]